MTVMRDTHIIEIPDRLSRRVPDTWTREGKTQRVRAILVQHGRFMALQARMIAIESKRKPWKA